MRRKLVARRARLIGMRGGENFQRRRARLVLLEHVEPHVAALAKNFAIALRPGRRYAEHALTIDHVIHRCPPPLMVMAGLVPAISLSFAQCPPKRDARHKAGHDGGGIYSRGTLSAASFEISSALSSVQIAAISGVMS